MQIEPEHAEESSCFSQIILLASLSQAPLSESDQDFCSGKNLNRESDFGSILDHARITKRNRELWFTFVSRNTKSFVAF
ncbi:hypothetical protein AtNW77_Chr5g0118711 [Arabidopsis thaliana]